MFAIVWYWAVAAIFLAALLYIYIDYRQVQVDWGTGLGGLRLQLAVQAILSAGREVRAKLGAKLLLLLKVQLSLWLQLAGMKAENCCHVISLRSLLRLCLCSSQS